MSTDDWLSLLRSTDYVWLDQHPGASVQDVQSVSSLIGRPLPRDYLAFLMRWDGAYLRFDDLWQVRVWRTRDIPSWSTTFGLVPENITGALAFGDDGGSEVLVFDTRASHPDGQYPVLAVNYLTVSWGDALFVAEDFRSLLMLRHGLLAGKAQR